MEDSIMRIGMILLKNFPPDIRVEKEIRSLIKEGHEIFLLCYSENELKDEEGIINNVRVRWIRRVKDVLSIPIRQLNSLRFYLTFYNNYIANKIISFVEDFNIQILHVHDLPPLGTTVSVGSYLNCPIIADLHENYPAVLKLIYKDKKSFDSVFAMNTKRWSFYERNVLHKVKHIIVVVDEAKNRLIEQHKLKAANITVIMNLEDVEYFSQFKYDPSVLEHYKSNFIISYVGGGGEHRGLDTAIHSLKYLKDKIGNVLLLLVGLKDFEYTELIKKAEKEGVKGQVEIINWQPFRKIPSYIRVSDVCLIPHKKNPHTDNTIPHKLFQYMLMGKPVVVSNCQPLERIVKNTGCGIVFNSGNSKELANSILLLYNNPELREEYGISGREAVYSRYNWELESKKLTSLYNSLRDKSE